MRLPRKSYETRNQKVIDFVIGFFGWFLLNAAMWGGATLVTRWLAEGRGDGNQVATVLTFLAWCLPLAVNLVALYFLAITRRFVALGALAAFGLVLLIPIIAGIFFVAVCFVQTVRYGPQ